jgi:hypothetical protein
MASYRDSITFYCIAVVKSIVFSCPSATRVTLSNFDFRYGNVWDTNDGTCLFVVSGYNLFLRTPTPLKVASDRF